MNPAPITISDRTPRLSNGWEWVPLGDVAQLATGHTPDRSVPGYWNGGIPWISLTEIRDLDGRVAERTELNVSEEGIRHSSSVVLPPGTVCLSRTASVGFVTVMGSAMATSQDFVNWVCGPSLEPRYLMRALIASRQHLRSLSTGSTHKTLYMRVAERFRVLMPPIDEQRRIAAILEKADELRAKRRAAADLFNPLIESLLHDVLVEGRQEGWLQVEIGDLAAPTKNSIRTGPFGSQLLHSEFTDSGVPVLGIDNVVSNYFEWAKPRYITQEKYQQLDRYTVQPGDVLVSIMGTCGRVAIAPADLPCSINSKHLCCITLERRACLPQYLRAALLFDPGVRAQLGAKERGAVMPGLNMQIIRQTRVTLPPLSVQEEFVEAVERVDRLRTQALHLSHGLHEAVNSLSTFAFSGRL